MAGHRIQPVIDTGLIAWGDSLTQASSGNVVQADRWPQRLGGRFTPKRICANSGVGGERSDETLARMIVYPMTAIQVIGTGRNDVGQSVAQATTMANIASMRALIPHSRFVLWSVLAYADGTEPVGSDKRNACLALNAAIAAAYPDNYLDVFALLDDNSLRTDGLHLNVAGQRLLETAIFNFITAKGW